MGMVHMELVVEAIYGCEKHAGPTVESFEVEDDTAYDILKFYNLTQQSNGAITDEFGRLVGGAGDLSTEEED